MSNLRQSIDPNLIEMESMRCKPSSRSIIQKYTTLK